MNCGDVSSPIYYETYHITSSKRCVSRADGRPGNLGEGWAIINTTYFWSGFASNTNKVRDGGNGPPPPHLLLFPPALKCVQSNPFYNAHHRKGGTTTPRKNTQLEICNRHAKHWNDDEKRYIFGAIKPWYMGEKSFGDFILEIGIQNGVFFYREYAEMKRE